MYSYEDRIRAIELYIKLGKRVRPTIRQLGYSTKNSLKGCRVRVHLVVVLEDGGHLRHHRSHVDKVHAADVIALERVHEALGHAVALGTAQLC